MMFFLNIVESVCRYAIGDSVSMTINHGTSKNKFPNCIAILFTRLRGLLTFDLFIRSRYSGQTSLKDIDLSRGSHSGFWLKINGIFLF